MTLAPSAERTERYATGSEMRGGIANPPRSLSGKAFGGLQFVAAVSRNVGPKG